MNFMEFHEKGMKFSEIHLLKIYMHRSDIDACLRCFSSKHYPFF